MPSLHSNFGDEDDESDALPMGRATLKRQSLSILQQAKGAPAAPPGAAPPLPTSGAPSYSYGTAPFPSGAAPSWSSSENRGMQQWQSPPPQSQYKSPQSQYPVSSSSAAPAGSGGGKGKDWALTEDMMQQPWGTRQALAPPPCVPCRPSFPAMRCTRAEGVRFATDAGASIFITRVLTVSIAALCCACGCTGTVLRTLNRK